MDTIWGTMSLIWPLCSVDYEKNPRGDSMVSVNHSKIQNIQIRQYFLVLNHKKTNQMVIKRRSCCREINEYLFGTGMILLGSGKFCNTNTEYLQPFRERMTS